MVQTYGKKVQNSIDIWWKSTEGCQVQLNFSEMIQQHRQHTLLSSKPLIRKENHVLHIIIQQVVIYQYTLCKNSPSIMHFDPPLSCISTEEGAVEKQPSHPSERGRGMGVDTNPGVQKPIEGFASKYGFTSHKMAPYSQRYLHLFRYLPLKTYQCSRMRQPTSSRFTRGSGGIYKTLAL